VLVGHPQRDAQVGVRAQVVLDHPRRALGRQDQVQAERAATLGDVHHPVDELRHLLHQGGELVDHDDQRRRGARVTGTLHREQVLRPRGREQVLAVTQLGPQRGQRAPHQVRRQVGDQTHAVRQVHAVRERRTTLVVHEQERHPVGAVRRRHAQHPRLQELALARPGRPTHQRVRTLRPQIQHELPVRALTHHGAQGGVGPSAHGRAGAIEHRPGLVPPGHDGRGVLGQVVPREREEADAARQV
jgi:hypothetical protein